MILVERMGLSAQPEFGRMVKMSDLHPCVLFFPMEQDLIFPSLGFGGALCGVSFHFMVWVFGWLGFGLGLLFGFITGVINPMCLISSWEISLHLPYPTPRSVRMQNVSCGVTFIA